MGRMDRAKMALVIMGGIVVMSLLSILLLGLFGQDVPEQVWDLLQLVFYTSLTVFASVAGAQAINGKIKEQNNSKQDNSKQE